MRIFVVGAGIAGLVAAVAAHRAGHEVTVVERSPVGSAAGAGISLFGNALRGLDSIPTTSSGTVGDRIREVGGGLAPGSDIGFRTPRGRWLVRSAVGTEGQVGPGSEVVVVHRADLQRILLAELPAEIVHFDSSCRQVRQRGDGTMEISWTRKMAAATAVTSASASPDGAGPEDAVSTADLVIAADGINSPLRRTGWTDDPGIHYAGYTSWRGITAQPFALRSGGETWGRGERFGCAPLQDGRVYWFATASIEANTNFPDEHAEVLRRFGKWHDPIPELIAATVPSAVLHHDINDLHGHCAPSSRAGSSWSATARTR